MGCGVSAEEKSRLGAEAPLMDLKSLAGDSARGTLFRLGLETGVEYFIVAEDAHDGLCATFDDVSTDLPNTASDEDALPLPPGVELIGLRLTLFSHDVEEGASAIKHRPFVKLRLHASPRHSVQHAGATVIFELMTQPSATLQSGSPRGAAGPRYALGTVARRGGVAPVLVRCPIDDNLDMLHTHRTAMDHHETETASVSIEWAVSMCGFASHDDAVTICALPPPLWTCGDARLPSLWHEPQTPAQPSVVVLSMVQPQIGVSLPTALEVRRCPTAASLSEELHVLEEAAPRCALRLVTVEEEWNQCLSSSLSKAPHHDTHRDGLHGCWVAVHWSETPSAQLRRTPSPAPADDPKDHSGLLAPWTGKGDEATPFDDSLGPALAGALLLASRDPLPRMPAKLPTAQSAFVGFAVGLPEQLGLPHHSFMVMRPAGGVATASTREILVANAAGTLVSFFPVEDIVAGDGAPDLLRRLAFRTKMTNVSASNSGSASTLTRKDSSSFSMTAASRYALRCCAFDQRLFLTPADDAAKQGSGAVAALLSEQQPAGAAYLYRTSPHVNFVPTALPRFGNGLSLLINPATSRVVRCTVPLFKSAAGDVVQQQRGNLLPLPRREFDVQLLIFGAREQRSTALLRFVSTSDASLRSSSHVCYGAIDNGQLVAVDGDTALESLLHSTYADVTRFKWDLGGAVADGHVSLVPRAAPGMALSWHEEKGTLSVTPNVFDRKRQGFVLHPM